MNQYYDTSIQCQYLDPLFTDDDDVRDHQYHQELLRIFKLKEYDDDISHCIEHKLYPLLSSKADIMNCIKLASVKYRVDDLLCATFFLFSYHHFSYIHQCIQHILAETDYSEPLSKLTASLQ